MISKTVHKHLHFCPRGCRYLRDLLDCTGAAAQLKTRQLASRPLVCTLLGAVWQHHLYAKCLHTW